MIVLEGDQPLGDAAHRYYAGLIDKLKADTKHVEHVQDFWGDPLTAAGSQSADGKAAYVQLYLAGNQGESLANESVDAIRKIVSDSLVDEPGIVAASRVAQRLIAFQNDHRRTVGAELFEIRSSSEYPAPSGRARR